MNTEELTQYDRTSEFLSLKLKTPGSAADASAVASMLRAIVVLVEETRDELGMQGGLSIRVSALRVGSLEIPLEVYMYGAFATLFTFNPELSKLFDTIKAFFELKKQLKGDLPTDNPIQDEVSIGNITVTGSHNVVNIIQQTRVKEAFDQAAKDLEKDSSLTGIKLTNQSSGVELADIQREEFLYFRIKNENHAVEIIQDRIRVVQTVLTIHTPVLTGTAKWKFLYDGKQISASIKDEHFLSRVGNGEEAFRNGDRLKVELEIGEQFVETFADYVRTNQYSISKVIEHIPRPTRPMQLPLLME